MANFPALEPRTRSLTYGDYPQSIFSGQSGGNVRFLMATDRIAQRLNITYEYLTETQIKLLTDHFDTQQGSLIPFDLSSEVKSGFSSFPVSASEYQWRYTGPFNVGISSPMRYNCSIELETVPI